MLRVGRQVEVLAGQKPQPRQRGLRPVNLGRQDLVPRFRPIFALAVLGRAVRIVIAIPAQRQHRHVLHRTHCPVGLKIAGLRRLLRPREIRVLLLRNLVDPDVEIVGQGDEMRRLALD